MIGTEKGSGGGLGGRPKWGQLADAGQRDRSPGGETTGLVILAFAYLTNGGTLELAQAMAAHESPLTTKLYDRTTERLTLDEIERIRL